MPKNRDYTGLERTPSSMAWLIRQRSKVRGQLDKLSALKETLPERIRVIEEELAALDAVIPLHEVKVEPTVIKGTRAKRPAIGGYGFLTRFLLDRLREADGRPLYTTELALEVARASGLQTEQHDMADLMDRVGRRLGVLAQQGHVRRHHPTETQMLGSWSLIIDDPEAP